ncbi:MAG: hypothetical protein AAGF93_00455 [Cyanobacteria bacterium P01_H01_bin.105]
MIFTTFSVPTLQTPAIRARRWWANGGQEITLRAIEHRAEMFSNFLTQLMLDAIDSGIIVRRWWENRGKDQAVELAWFAARAIALATMLLACLVCVAIYWVVRSFRSASVVLCWVASEGVPAGVNILDRTVAFVLCYEANPHQQGRLTTTSAIAPSPASVYFDSTDREVQEMVEWAKAKWPQLNS